MMEEQKGLPIYMDPARNLAGSTTDVVDISAWHPSNASAQRLWRCFEALRDIENLLKGTAILASEEDRRRRSKILITPLYALCVAVKDLCNYLTSAPEFRNKENKAQRDEISKALAQFLSVVPLESTGAMRGVRDQLSAHVDKIMSYEAQAIFNKAQTHEVGTWLHTCITTVIQLLSHDSYGWTPGDYPEGCVQFMNVEPWLITFDLKDGEPHRIVGMDMVEKSPRQSVVEVCKAIVNTSQWMFRPEDKRINVLKDESESLDAENEK
ncbi:MAG: hypothetical protein AAFW84_04330 [Cyanobacteria bacterium J06635_15]